MLLVGDIHGEYRKFERALELSQYDPSADALILLGDLIDRGPDSEDHAYWLSRKDVIRILGNHEMMPGMLLSRIISRKTAIAWGGAWFVDKDEDDLQSLSRALTDAPIALTLTTPHGRTVGVVHADCSKDWGRHVLVLEDHTHLRHRDVRELSLWERGSFKDAQIGRVEDCRVTGVDHVFHGHSPVEEVLTCANRTWVDTGACYGGKVTILDVDRWLDDMNAGGISGGGGGLFAA